MTIGRHPIWALDSAVFNLGIENEFDGITTNPFTLVKKLLPPQNKGAKREVTPSTLHTLLDVATERQAPLLALLGLQGLRISEGCGALGRTSTSTGARSTSRPSLVRTGSGRRS